MTRLWVIQGRDMLDFKVVYWSNKDGWVDSRHATRFTTEEHRTLQLPVGHQVHWIAIVE